MKTIILKLFPTGDCPGGIWTAEHYVDDEPEPYIVDLFGTHSIATPYTYLTPGESVRFYLERLNPAYEVRLG